MRTPLVPGLVPGLALGLAFPAAAFAHPGHDAADHLAALVPWAALAAVAAGGLLARAALRRRAARANGERPSGAAS